MNPTEKARQIIVKQEIKSFITDIPEMKFDKPLCFETFSGYAKTIGVPVSVYAQIEDGCTLIHSDPHGRKTYLILTRETSPQRRRWTLAHEIGHVCLEHVRDEDKEEREANSFASELLIPELVVLELQRRLGRSLISEEISRLFGVSLAAADGKVNQIKRKEYFSPFLKEEVLSKYESLIDDFINKKSRGKLCQTSLQS